MIWWFLGIKNISLALILDMILILLPIILTALIVKWKREYGAWMELAKYDHIVLAIGRDHNARLIPAKRHHGIYLNLGEYGDVPLDGEAVYKIINVPQKNSISILYLPYALLLRAKEMAGIRKMVKGEVKQIGKNVKIVDEEGNTLYECFEQGSNSCEQKIKQETRKLEKQDETFETVEEPVVQAEINEPVIIRPEDIVKWQIYSFNPIILRSMNESYTVSELGRYKSILESPWIKLLPIIAVISIVALILAFIK